MNSLEGVTVIVTGAARGIGRSIALAAGNAGAKVGLVDQLDCEDVCRQLSEAGAHACSYQADISKSAEVADAFAKIVEELGEVNALVNNAGIQLEKPLLDTTTSDFDAVMDSNVRGMVLMSQQVLRAMTDSAIHGRVINIASDLAYHGRENFSVYCASKAAVLALTKSWAREFAPDILINSICPGPVDTAMLSRDQMSAEWIAKESEIPLERIGQPGEIAAIAVFLLGSGATFITGQGFGVNGGSVMP